MSIESSNTTMINSFQQEQNESSRFKKFQKELRFQEISKSKLFSFEMIFQQQFEFKMMKIKLTMMKLEVQKLTN